MRISVALCTYNGASFLTQQLESILAQTRVPDEMVVRDDRSTDSTAEIVAAFAKTAPFPVSFEVNDSRLGVTKNFERTVAGCSGDVIFLCDQDDYWLPDKIRKLAREFEVDDSVGLVFSNAVVTDAQLNLLGYTMWEIVGLGKEALRRLGGGGALDQFIRQYTVTGATAAFRGSLWSRIKPIPQVYPHDAWIALIAAACSRVVAVNAPLTLYRQHGANSTGAGKKNLIERTKASRGTPAREFDLEIIRNRELLGTLISFSADRVEGRHLESIESKIGHLMARREMFARGFLRRVPIVAQELGSLRYFEFSSGLLSAAADLFLRR
jgi:glycosyltransferase involved in cell wall biosynthesis